MLLAVLAHQGGWDEALLIATPLAALAGLLYLANKRADRQLNADEATNAGEVDDRTTEPSASSIDS